jgi:hypothetical protein
VDHRVSYLPIRSHDVNTPGRWVGSMVTRSISNSFSTVSFGTPSTDDLGLGSGAQLNTPAGVTGWYTIAIGLLPAQANVEHYIYRLLIGGSVVRTGERSFNTNGTNQTGGENGTNWHFFSGIINPSQTIEFQAMTTLATVHDLATAGAGTVEITFVPIPSHRFR